MINRTILQEDITLVNIYTPNIGTPKYMKHVLMDMKGKNNRNTVKLGVLTSHWLQWIDLPDRKSMR